MTGSQSDPPKRAIWLLQHAYPGDNEALTGDLIERFREGQTRAWFWRQVLFAIAVGVLGQVRRHWPYFCYAIAGWAAPLLLSQNVEGLPRLLHWWLVPWPWSQLIFEWSGSVLLRLAPLPVLAAAMVINREFHWAGLLRTAAISLLLMALGRYSLGVLADTLPGLLRHTSEPHWMTIAILSPPSLELLFFSSFLVSAWLGCRRSSLPADDWNALAQ